MGQQQLTAENDSIGGASQMRSSPLVCVSLCVQTHFLASDLLVNHNVDFSGAAQMSLLNAFGGHDPVEAKELARIKRQSLEIDKQRVGQQTNYRSQL